MPTVTDFDTWLADQPTAAILEAVEEQDTYGRRGTYDQLVAELRRRGLHP